MAPAVFKTVVGREERPGCVRFARASAMNTRTEGRLPLKLFTAEDLEVAVRCDCGSQRLLDGTSLDLDAGEIVEVRGPSGSGKTTLLRVLARMQPQASGLLTLRGRDSAEFAPAEWRRHVTLLPQVTMLAPGTVRDNLLLPWHLKIRLGQSPPSDAGLTEALASVGLPSVALTRDAAQLSVGQAARIALLRVILTGPDILLLDEPDAGLDDESAAMVSAAVVAFAEGGGAVLSVRHQRQDACASRCLYLSGGALSEVAG